MSTNSNTAGGIVSLHLCTGHREPMSSVDTANVVTGLGIEGDRHASSATPARIKRQVLLIDEETLEAFGLSHGEVRENVTTSGIDLSSLRAGEQLSLGATAVLQITGVCDPCDRMDEIRNGLRQEIEGRRGMLATVIEGGTIRVGDPVRAVEKAVAS